ncbi:DNA repair protein RecO [Thalassotalea euphylliae]|uniref:DNA repair protein RecO n=1 Tax=Thalassotalea euphylliae TaxID=1655234 RepID=A0A3E0TNV5_9GAMM|nr:DNA repair protein RecO [Thalassotalea euphylliae]REL25762.1 DNA repair protein RecO [Thalassotalea euphylliae]
MLLPQPQTAYILHSRPYQEHKLLVELLTAEEGKVAAVVYAGKTAKSNKKALLQPFLPITVTLKGKSQLKSLSAIEANGKSLLLSGEPLYCGFYVNELLVRLLPELVPCPWLFDCYQQTLGCLAERGVDQQALRQFELTLLEELGIGLDFSALQNIHTDSVSFNLESGFTEPLSGLPTYSKTALSGMATGQLSDNVNLYTAKSLMRNIINQLLGNKPLNSRSLFDKK